MTICARFSLEASDVTYGIYEPATITEPNDHTYWIDVVRSCAGSWGAKLAGFHSAMTMAITIVSISPEAFNFGATMEPQPNHGLT